MRNFSENTGFGRGAATLLINSVELLERNFSENTVFGRGPITLIMIQGSSSDKFLRKC